MAISKGIQQGNLVLHGHSAGDAGGGVCALAFAQAVHGDDHGMPRVPPHQREHS